MAKRTIDQLTLKNKRVLMRVDFNVPMDKTTGKITDDNRIVEALPSIKRVVAEGGKLVLMSHLGKPKGEKKPGLSLKPVAERLGELLKKPVRFVEDCVGETVETAISQMSEGDVVVLENLRFYKEEEKNDPEFARKLAGLGDVYINDAFGTAHRAHASTAGVVDYIAENALGYLMAKEVKFLGMALENPTRPYVAVMGGAKVSDKINVIINLMEKVDALLIGGGMIFTFFKAMGLEIGKSLVEDDRLEIAKEIIEKAKKMNVQLLLPDDVVVAAEFKADAEHKTVDKAEIPAGWMGLDVGPKTIEKFSAVLKTAKTIVWNGPMGVFEMPAFANGTIELAKVIAHATQYNDAVSIIGGGDSAAAIAQTGLKDRITHISTGGGASLEYLEGLVLPGIAAIQDN